MAQEDLDENGTYENREKLYVIQMLRLRGFDAGTKHNFSLTDGTINP